MDRQQLIEELTRYELVYFYENYDKHTLTEMTDFFASGGFHNYKDEDLARKYELILIEEE